MASSSDRDFLLHLETFLAKRDGVDKLLKLLRYTTKLLHLTTSPQTLTPRLRSFDSSLGTARKAFRLGKFIQSLNALRASPLSPPSALAYAGEGVYYFVEQFVWLSKAGLIDKRHLVWLQKVSAWAELVGYVGSIYLKVAEVKKITFLIEKIGKEEGDEEEEVRRLREKLLIKRLSVLQDVADAVMALADVRDGKGRFTHPVLLASAGLLSAVISGHKNWVSC